MKIHQLEKSKGLKDKQRRRGRGNATGTGNYSGRGLKGQKARSGFSMKPFFEGGQTSIVQRLPKARGFTRYYKFIKDVIIINLGNLDADIRISDAMEITKQILKDLGYIKSATDFVKILSHGDYAKHLTFKDIDAFSAAAKIKIDKPGTVHSLAKKIPAKPEKQAHKLKIKSTKPKSTLVVKQTKKIEIPKQIPAKISIEKKEIKKVEPVKSVEKKEVVVKKPIKKEEVTVEKKSAPVKKSVEKKIAIEKKSVAKKIVKPVAKKPSSKK